MLEKFLNRRVKIYVTTYGSGTAFRENANREGVVTNLDEKYIELDNNVVIQIKYIVSIEAK